MDEPIEEVYFNWLYQKVARVVVPTPSLTYFTLLRDLHSTEFVWTLIGDDNRSEDGLDLRKEFLREVYMDNDIPWMHIPCSVLEMLIALARKASFQTDRSIHEWFWIFMENLGLEQMTDARSRVSERVYETTHIFVWREYDYTGRGGIFPLKAPEHDQRKVEIWGQFFDYLIDQEN